MTSSRALGGSGWHQMFRHVLPNYLEREPLLLIWPSVAIALAIGSFNLMGDGLRDAIDPRLRGAGRRRADADLRTDRVGALSKA